MRRPKKDVYEAIIFVAMAYALSWSIFWGATNAGIEPLIVLGVWGPTLSAIVLSAVFAGGAGVLDLFRRLGRWRVAIQWYVIVIAGPIAINALGVLLWNVFSGVQTPFDLAIAPLTSLLPVLAVSLLIPALGEELGWRGFALPRLQAATGPIMAGLIVGVIHALWHLPTYWLGTGTHTVPLLWFIAWVVALSILFTWVLLHTRGSLLMAVLFHAFSNVSLSAVQVLPAEDRVPISPDLISNLTLPLDVSGPYLVCLTLYWLLAISVIATGGMRPAERGAVAET